MGIGSDIAPKPQPKKEKPKVEPKMDPETVKKAKLKPGEVEVGVSVVNNKTNDLYSDFLSDWDQNADKNEGHHHHDHLHADNAETNQPSSDQSEDNEKNNDNLDENQNNDDKGGGLVKWIVLFFVVLTAIIVWQNYPKIAEIFNFSSEEDLLDTDEETTYYDNSDTDYTAPVADESTTATDETTASTIIDKTTIAIQVLNGNGTTGSGVVAKQVLEDAGFIVSSTTNAKRYNYATSIVYYKAGKEAEAKLVNESLSAYVTELINLDSVVGIYDVVIVIGAT